MASDIAKVSQLAFFPNYSPLVLEEPYCFAPRLQKSIESLQKEPSLHKEP